MISCISVSHIYYYALLICRKSKKSRRNDSKLAIVSSAFIALFPVREACEEITLDRRETVFAFFGADCPDKESHITCKVSHRLETFEIFLHVFCREVIKLLRACSQGKHEKQPCYQESTSHYVFFLLTIKIKYLAVFQITFQVVVDMNGTYSCWCSSI